MLEKIAGKYIIIFAMAVMLSLSVVLYISYSKVQLANDEISKQIDNQNQKRTLLIELSHTTRDRFTVLLKMSHETDPFVLDDLQIEFSELATEFLILREKLLAYFLDEIEIGILNDQHLGTKINAPLLNKASQLFLAGKHDEGIDLLFGEIISSQNFVLSQFDQIIEYYDEDSKNRRDELEARKKEVNTSFKLYSILLFLGGSFIILILILYILKREKKYFDQQITQQKNHSKKLSYQASHDPLTNLINRREFEFRLEQLLGRSIDKEKHAVLYLDLDQFKVVNDTCGHNAGDELLKQLPEVIKENLRSSDLLARLGGDEFAIILMNCEIHHVKRICQSIIDSLMEFQFSWNDKTFKIGVSIGVVEITDNSIDLNDTLRFADSACYAAKEAGRNQFKLHTKDDKQLKSRSDEMDWLSTINNALEYSLFLLYAQIIVPTDPKSELKPSYELLVRMDLDGKIVPPGAFLPAAERYNQMIAIDEYVVSRGIAMMSIEPDFLKEIDHISFNLSTLSLSNKDFLKFLVEKITAGGFPEKICLEITETAIINNLANVKRAMRVLRKMGVRFSLDDFGSGQSSYAYLKNLDVDYLKIDGYFVKDILTDSVDRAMVKSMSDISSAMNKKSIAEFVENEEVLDVLKDIGIDYAQGYGLGMPLPFADIIKIDSINRKVKSMN